MKAPATVDEYILGSDLWRNELQIIREILHSTPLVENMKWGAPCYTYKSKNVVGIGAFKSYFGLWFFQGALLSDDSGLLTNAQEGVTKALRQWRMSSAQEIRPAIIKQYVKEAIGHVEAGREIKADKKRPVEVPRELRNAMRRLKGSTAAYRQLPKGQQREYADYITSAKRKDTRLRRIEKILPMIMSGQGLHDKYRR